MSWQMHCPARQTQRYNPNKLQPFLSLPLFVLGRVDPVGLLLLRNPSSTLWIPVQLLLQWTSRERSCGVKKKCKVITLIHH